MAHIIDLDNTETRHLAATTSPERPASSPASSEHEDTPVLSEPEDPDATFRLERFDEKEFEYGVEPGYSSETDYLVPHSFRKHYDMDSAAGEVREERISAAEMDVSASSV